MRSKQGQLVVSYTKTGLPRYSLEIQHRGLHKYQVVRADNPYIVQQKARNAMSKWDQMWNRREEKEAKANSIQEKKEQALQRTREAEAALARLDTILAHTLTVNDAVDWQSLKSTADYSVPEPLPIASACEPRKTDWKYEVKLGILDWLFTSRRIAKRLKTNEQYEADHNLWERRRQEAEAEYATQLAEWQKDHDKYIEERNASNAAIDRQRNAYLKKTDPQAVLDYCDLVLSNSEYPDYFPQSYEFEYNPETEVLIVDYQLPSKDDIPTLVEVRYVPSRNELSEKHLSEGQLNKRYDCLLYQVAIRTIHELYEADQINALAAVVFNGYVNATDPATGQEHNSCILSLQAGSDEFKQINLAKIDPRACFRSLRGVSASKLHSLTPVAPILTIDREDSRFVPSYAVAESVRGTNLAAMDWEDFEHLIRELFEKEFASAGGEVKVTRASRDGGIDAVVFDPDPIRGGKIVIQAKRYTNTVGVSAVRDLYGTLMNEGANKGILVTTSDYGPDAHQFARGKPISLLSGAQLLFLLEKHGHKARIDLREAKQILSEEGSA